MARKYDKLYGREGDKKEVIQYETIKLPLQDQISTVRKFFCKTWQQFKVEKDKFTNSVTNSFQTVNTKTKGALKSVGIENSSVALQAGAIGTAALTGVLVARKKSPIYRLLYPTLGAGIVWGTIYSSTAENRAHIRSELKSLWNKYLTTSK